jgi:outer membrane protein assembly factor BamB
MLILLITLICLIRSSVYGDDWPQFRGPNRDGISKETGLLKKWPKGGPKLLWTYTEGGVGYSGPAIVGDRLYLEGGRGDSEYVYALDIKNTTEGIKEVWSAKMGPLFQWKGNSWNIGPNATPTVEKELIFALGGGGDFICVDRATGKEHWRKNLPKDFGGEVNPIGGGLEEPTPLGWGYACTPLVHEDHVLCTPGGKKGLLALLKTKTGELVWQSKEVQDQAPYSSPLLVEIGGVKQYIQATNSGIVGIRAKDGKRLWSYQRNPAYEDVVIASPIFSDNHVFTTVGFQQGNDLIKLIPKDDQITVEKIFSNKNVQNRNGGVVLVDGHLYGHTENKGWFCQEFKTGKMIWTEREKLPRGSIAYADGCLYCCAENGGTIILIEATPEGWKELGRLKLPRESKLRPPNGGLWTIPVISNGKLYIRDQDLLFCYDIKA